MYGETVKITLSNCDNPSEGETAEVSTSGELVGSDSVVTRLMLLNKEPILWIDHNKPKKDVTITWNGLPEGKTMPGILKYDGMEIPVIWVRVEGTHWPCVDCDLSNQKNPYFCAGSELCRFYDDKQELIQGKIKYLENTVE